MRAYEPSDAEAILAINAECVPEVGTMDEDKLAYFAQTAGFFAVVTAEDNDADVLGFLIGLDEELVEEIKQAIPFGVTHPLLRTHPETGRKSLYLNPIRIEALVGLGEAEALALLDELLTHATQERFQYRHKWRVGDLVLWDNRCLLHKANGDYDHAQTRYLYRVMLQGDQPR